MNLDQWMILLLAEHVIGTIIGIFAGVELTFWVLRKIPYVGAMLPKDLWGLSRCWKGKGETVGVPNEVKK